MDPIVFEIVFDSSDLLASGFESRDQIEESLEAALTESGYGEVTGGGSGMGEAIIDVEISVEAPFQDALAFLRTTLQRLSGPRTTVIKRYLPQDRPKRSCENSNPVFAANVSNECGACFRVAVFSVL